MKRKFRISIEVNGGMTLFDSTNSEKQVNEWIKAFTETDKAKSIKVYELNAQVGAYTLAKTIERKDETPLVREIGFGRW